MEKTVFVFNRFHDYGYDQIRILAYTKDQAYLILEETVKDFDSWDYDYRFVPNELTEAEKEFGKV